jgi:hypothetical protein
MMATAAKMNTHKSPQSRSAARIARGMAIRRMLTGRSRKKARKLTKKFSFPAGMGTSYFPGITQERFYPILAALFGDTKKQAWYNYQ